MMKLICDNCGEIDHVLVDGYGFGDRLLEGVMFIVKDIGGHPKVEGVTPDSKDYFSDLNTKRWLKECEAFCKEDLDIATCPNCGDDVPVWNALSDDTGEFSREFVPIPLPDNLNEITKDEAKLALDHIFDGCPNAETKKSKKNNES